MKRFKKLRQDLDESLFDKFMDLFRKDQNAPLDRSRNVIVRPKDMRHERPAVTVMLRKHKDHRAGREAYDWTLKEPGTAKRYYGTLKKKSGGGWVVMGVGKNSKPEVEINQHGDSLKAIKKIYKILSKTEGSTTSSFPLVSRGNALSRSLTNR